MTRLPGLDQLPLVVFKFIVDQEVFTRPTGALLRRAVVVSDCEFDARRANLDFLQLFDERTLVQVGNNGLRR
jgi:hypothetical protein